MKRTKNYRYAEGHSDAYAGSPAIAALARDIKTVCGPRVSCSLGSRKNSSA